MPEEKKAVESAIQSAKVEGKQITKNEKEIIESELSKTDVSGPESFLYKLNMLYQKLEMENKHERKKGR